MVESLLRSRVGVAMTLSSLALVSFVACSSSDSATRGSSSSSGGADGGSSSGAQSSGAIDVPVTDYAKAFCARIHRCEPGIVEEQWGDEATCAQNFSFAFYPIENAANSGQTTTTEAACAAKLATDECGAKQPPECEFFGKQAAGGACYLGKQCTTGSCWYAQQPSATNPCGKCQAEAKLGEDCTNAQCESDTECDQGGTNKCVAPPALGGDCTNVDCASGFVCIGNKCAAEIKVDQPCTASTSQADQDPCERDAVCVTGKCTKVEVTAKVGDACGGATACIDSVCFKGKCAAYAKLGEACDETGEQPPLCQSPMLCYKGKCTYSDVADCK